jgi:hypothetical protein
MNSSTSSRAFGFFALGRSLWLLVWIELGLYLAFTLWLGFAGLVYPYQLDYGEGIVLWFARQIAHGHSIYKEMTGFPYASSNYPPVSMLLTGALMPIFGEGYAAGRLLNFASALIVAALIYRIVHVETRNRRVGAIAALLFIGSPYIYHWVPLFRADLIGLAFAFGGVYAVWEAERRRQTTDDRRPALYLIFAAWLFLLALYTKQTLVAAPMAAFLAIFRHSRRVAFALALALGASGGAIYLGLDYATGGGFTFGLITSNATVFLPEQLVTLWQNFAATFAALLLLALWGWLKRVKAKRAGVLEWYAVTSFAVLVMAGRVGAWENYFFEAIAAACVFAGMGIRNSELAIRKVQFAIPLLLLVQLALMWHDPRIAANLFAEDLPANQQLVALLARTPGTMISEDMGALVTSGKEVAYYTFQYSSLARSGVWDQSWELNGLRDGVFPLVILERGTREDVDRYRRFTREFVSALDRYYQRSVVMGKYEIYRSAPLAHLQSANFGGEIAMVGWSVQPATLQPGAIQVTIVWQAKRAMARRYTAFVHLENAVGGRVTQDDHEPLRGIYPTTRWATNEMVREMYTLNVPGNLPSGKYILRVGWYAAETGERLAVPGSADDAVVLTTFEVGG